MKPTAINNLALINPATGCIATATGRIIAGTPVYYSSDVPIGLITPFDKGLTAEVSRQSETDAHKSTPDAES
jgi:hypothetical protein